MPLPACESVSLTLKLIYKEKGIVFFSYQKFFKHRKNKKKLFNKKMLSEMLATVLLVLLIQSARLANCFEHYNNGDIVHEQEFKHDNIGPNMDVSSDFAKFLSTKHASKMPDKKKPNSYSFLKYLLNDGQSKGNVRCENPDQDYLENLLSTYQTFYRRFEESILKSNPDSSSYQDTSQIPKQLNYYKDQSQCNLNDRNTSTINRRSLCPWKYVVTVRADRFPPYRTEVKCTCDTCNLIGNEILPKNFYGCFPVFKAMPVLVKEECGADGHYIWRPTTEDVNVACTCGINQNFVSHGKR